MCFSRVSRGSPVGLPWVDSKANIQKKCTIFKIPSTIPNTAFTTHHPPSHHPKPTISKAIISKPPSSIPILPLPYNTFSFPTRDHSASPFLLSCSACSSWKARTTGFFTIHPRGQGCPTRAGVGPPFSPAPPTLRTTLQIRNHRYYLLDYCERVNSSFYKHTRTHAYSFREVPFTRSCVNIFKQRDPDVYQGLLVSSTLYESGLYHHARITP